MRRRRRRMRDKRNAMRGPQFTPPQHAFTPKQSPVKTEPHPQRPQITAPLFDHIHIEPRKIGVSDRIIYVGFKPIDPQPGAAYYYGGRLWWQGSVMEMTIDKALQLITPVVLVISQKFGLAPRMNRSYLYITEPIEDASLPVMVPTEELAKQVPNSIVCPIDHAIIHP